MNVLICGSRNWTDGVFMRAVILGLADLWTLKIITGGARGADTIAHEIATHYGCRTQVFKADWEAHGKAAGPIRNQQMLDEGKPGLVVAFTNNLEESRGTADMVRRAKKAEIPVYVIGAA